uniref:J domain-containing protein required for chloroplast accumulation response 1 n=1 Tax=Davidia involucrata TaxID=16924 RepID=A0A5B6ZSI9_DAVIN
MERSTQRGIVLLGYSPQRSLGKPSSVPPKTPLRNSDVDFHDVFGGPPRRYSIHEMRRHRFSETSSFRGEEDAVLSESPWSGLSEKPVFGEDSANRRRYPSGDFFDDIFRGDESYISPRSSDPFGSSLSAPFSLPAKLTKAMDLAAFDSDNSSPYKYKDGISNGINIPYAPSASLSRFSSKAIQGQDESRNHVQPSYCQSPLTHEFSRSSKKPSYINKSDETDIGGNLKKDLKSGETPSNNNQFHFSIYKWASKGVPFRMPLRRGNSSKSRERSNIERSSSSKGRIESDSMVCELQRANLQDIDTLFLNHSQIVEEAILAMPDLKSHDSFQSAVDDVILSDEREEIKPHSLPETGLRGKTKKEMSVSIEEASKPKLKSLLSLSNEKQGNDEITGKESVVKMTKVSQSNVDVTENVKKHDGKRISSNRAEVNKASLRGPPIKSGETIGRNGVKGKVKEFVKIFNQGASSKPKMNADIPSQSSRWKGKGIYGADNEASVSTTGMDGKMPLMVDKNLEQLEKQHSHMKTTTHKLRNNSSGSLLDSSKDTLGNIDDLFQEDFLIKELSHKQDKLLQTGEDYLDIQVLDVKIRQWSNGKEGNIRSLLSTLQYVLWPESGWKPVPLVDIIEGSAVKRAYQKALLYLHPDKLQQKGAASHQKYIAEKVFDILQGAWDHFNSLGLL